MTATTVHQSTALPRLVARTASIEPPADLLDHLGTDGQAWLCDDLSFVTSGAAATVAPADAASILEAISREGEGPHPASGPLAVGALPFAGTGRLVVPSSIVGVTRDGEAWRTTISAERAGSANTIEPLLPGPAPSRFTVEALADASVWRRQVEEALRLIEDGALTKVVLARVVRVEADRPFDRRAVLALLRASQPGCTIYADRGFVGATPELLVARRGAQVVSQPMAGSIPLGLDACDAAVSGLLASAKERVEHGLLVDAVREGLAPFCDDLRAGAPEAIRLATVTHLMTTVTARLRDATVSALDLAMALHPTPAVGGTPRADALEAIRRIEGFERGLYGGPVGWIGAGGDGDFAVALRCGLLDGAHARVFAGAGIVAGSDPGAEWAETQAKLEPMLRALVRP